MTQPTETKSQGVLSRTREIINKRKKSRKNDWLWQFDSDCTFGSYFFVFNWSCKFGVFSPRRLIFKIFGFLTQKTKTLQNAICQFSCPKLNHMKNDLSPTLYFIFILTDIFCTDFLLHQKSLLWIFANDREIEAFWPNFMLSIKSYEIFALICVLTGVFLGFIILVCHAKKVMINDEETQRAFLAQPG